MLTLKSRIGLALLSFTALAVSGCGGGGHHAGNNAALRMTLAWPLVDNRMVPNAANSVLAVVRVKGKEVARSMFVRPSNDRAPVNGAATTVLLERLPAGQATVTLTAYPTTDGAGTPQATGNATETLVRGQIVEDHATMASTVATLSLSPSAMSIAMGDQLPLELTARDASGAVVLLSTNRTESLIWNSSNESAATLSTNGDTTATVLPHGAGDTTISVSMVVDDAGAKKTASSPVTVTAPVRTLVSVSCSHEGTAAAPYDLEFPREQFELIGTYSDNTQEEISAQGTLIMDDPSVVSYSGGNLVRGALGQTTQGHWSVLGFSGSFYVHTSGS